MIEEALQMSVELRDELAMNNRQLLVDTRTMPARFSHLRAMGQSPAHCLAAFQDSRSYDSMACRIGSGVHAMLFDQPCVTYGAVRRSKAWDAFQLEHTDKLILSVKEHARSRAIADAVKQHPIASRILFGPDVTHERTLIWEQLGRARRTTPDAFNKSMVCELKTTKCSEPGRFVRDATFRGYAAQIADQVAAVEYATGVRPREAFIVSVESVAPYVVTVLQLTERALDRGAAQCRAWLERLIVSEQSNMWPGYSLAIEPFDVSDDFELTFGEDDARPTDD